MWRGRLRFDQTAMNMSPDLTGFMVLFAVIVTNTRSSKARQPGSRDLYIGACLETLSIIQSVSLRYTVEYYTIPSLLPRSGRDATTTFRGKKSEETAVWTTWVTTAAVSSRLCVHVNLARVATACGASRWCHRGV